jgi:uncharacterized protein (DUF4415 family)
MTEKKRVLGSDLEKIDAHVIQPEEYEEIPELTEEWFRQANYYKGGKLVRRGRPPSDASKKLVSLRLSPEVIDHFRSEGAGWQTRINDTLLEAVKRKRARSK